jgi:uncharacterized protein YjiS (DUF1127 family)
MSPAQTSAAPFAAVPAQGAPVPVTILAALRQAWRAFVNRLALRPLLEMDERMLRDIGLARGDVHDALGSGLGSDPSSRLAGTAARHAAAEEARLRASLRSHAVVKPARRDRAA